VKVVFYILFLITFSSVSQIKYKGKLNSSVKAESFSKVFFLTQFDSIPDTSNCFGNFVMKENNYPQWDSIWRELKRFAISKGCNAVKIDRYHTFLEKETHGNKVYIEGRVFYTLDTKKFYPEKDSIYLYILRYNSNEGFQKDNISTLYINNIPTGKIDDLSYYKIKVSFGDTINLKLADSKEVLKLPIESKQDHFMRYGKEYGPIQLGLSLNGIGMLPGHITSPGGVYLYRLNRIEGKMELENMIMIRKKNGTWK
jgi:hypothetical protein